MTVYKMEKKKQHKEKQLFFRFQDFNRASFSGTQEHRHLRAVSTWMSVFMPLSLLNRWSLRRPVITLLFWGLFCRNQLVRKKASRALRFAAGCENPAPNLSPSLEIQISDQLFHLSLSSFPGLGVRKRPNGHRGVWGYRMCLLPLLENDTARLPLHEVPTKIKLLPFA